MVVGLGIAFRNQPVEQIAVDVVGRSAGRRRGRGVLAEQVEIRRGSFQRRRRPLATAHRQDRAGRVGLGQRTPLSYEYYFDPTRPAEPAGAQRGRRCACSGQRAARTSRRSTEQAFNEPGGRYIDFLVPGLLGMSLMGGGLWGVGFVTVDMRIRKLLKRFLATPMRKSDFLAGIMISRLLFMVPEVIVLLVFARLAFGVRDLRQPAGRAGADPAGGGHVRRHWACWSPAGPGRSKPSRA